MYSKTNPGGISLGSRQKRVFAIVGAAFLLLLCGFAVWGELSHDKYGASANGCVNVNVPSSTGGSTLHYCGAQARSFCQTEFTSNDQIAKRARPQCLLAGIKPSSSASAGS